MTDPRSGLAAPDLPASIWQAMARAIRFTCPRCGGGRLFRKWLKPADHCGCCGLDFTPQQADDFPAYVAIILTGHLIAPIIIYLAAETALSTAAIFTILMSGSIAMMLAMLQPAKGAIIAAQWWNGMHGFRKERRAS